MLTLGPRGVLVAGLRDGELEVADLRTGRVKVVPAAEGYWASAAWIDERSLVLVKNVLGRWPSVDGRREVIVADVQAILDTAYAAP